MKPSSLAILPVLVLAPTAQLLEKFMVPLHTAPADPVAGAYGTWAAGHDYKVSFHGGFRLFPLLGARAPRNLPLAWRTESVQSGRGVLFQGGDLVGGRDGDWRFVFRHPGVVETYEVRAEGVLQSFTILGPAAGDLVVTGQIETELRPLSSGDLPIQFADASDVTRVTLDVARAIDSSDAPLPVQRTLSSRQLRLVIRGSDLVRARYPITIRQLTSAAVLLEGSDEYRDLDFTVWSEDAYVVFSRQYSSSDADSFGWRIDPATDRQPGIKGPFWADLSSQWSTVRPRLEVLAETAFVAGERTYANPQQSRVFLCRIHPPAHDLSSFFDYAWVPVSSGYTQRNPDLRIEGGIWLAWQEDLTQTDADTQTTRVCVAPFAEASGTFPQKWIVAESVNYDAENPVLGGGHVFWQQRPNLNFLPARIYARALDHNGPTTAPILHVSAAHPTHQCMRPRVGFKGASLLVASTKGLCAYEFSQGTVRGIAAVRIDAGQISFPRELSLSSQVHDLHDVITADTLNHWIVLYRRGAQLELQRLGRTGGTVATETPHNGTVTSACLGPDWVTWNSGSAGPLPNSVLYARSSVPDQLMQSRTAFSPDAKTFQYGAACGGTLDDSPFTVPAQAYAGGELVLSFFGPPQGTSCVLWIDLSAGSSTLPGGCTFLLGSSAQVAQPFVHTPVGFLMGHELRIPLADDPVFIGNLYLQVTWPDASNPSVTKASNGVAAYVR
jgi:hypothetical protein